MKRFYQPILGCLATVLLSTNLNAQDFGFTGGTNAILDNSTITKTATLTNQGIINVSEGKVPQVYLNLTHTYTNDLDISLTSPAGTTIDLTSDNGSGSDMNTTFSSFASASITSGTAPFTGSFLPEESFSAFDGEFADGTWTLTITDDAGGDQGTFIFSSISVRRNSPWSYQLDNSLGNEYYANTLQLPTTGVTWTENIHNESNGALFFDGTNHATAENNNFSGNAITLAAWIKPSDVTPDQKVANIADAANTADLFVLGLQNGQATFEVRSNNSGQKVIAGTLNDDEWVHIAGTWSTVDNTIRLYINGILAGTGTGPNTPINWDLPSSFLPTFGAAAWDPNFFKYTGSMDDMREYNYAMSAWQIRDIAANRNEYCETAVDLPVIGNSCDGSYYAHSFGGNGSNGPAVQCGGSGASSWFTVTVPTSGNLNISSASVTGSALYDNTIEAYSGTCDNLTYIDCNDQFNAGFAELQLVGLTPGDVIYVKAYNYYNSNDGQYVMCAFEPLPIAGNPSTVSPLCNGGDSGSASVSPSGGNAPYSYLWNTGSTSSSLTNVTAGTYTCTITDNSGVTYDEVIIVTEPTAISVPTTTTGATAGNNDGSATANPTGGTAPYTYLWSNGNVTQTATSLGVGTFSVTITDANGCTATGSANVGQSSVGIDELNSSIMVNLYPNPASENATVDAYLENAEEAEITLLNTMGQLVQTVQLGNSIALTHTFNVSELPAGTYFVKISTTSGLNQMKRLIVKK